MASTHLLRTLERTHNLAATMAAAAPLLSRALHTVTATKSLGGGGERRMRNDPDTGLIPVIDRWIQDGKKVKEPELRRVVRRLRSGRKYTQALEVFEWMSNRGLPYLAGDHALRLDLIGRVRGIDSAETYFNSLREEDKIDKKNHGALLNCYVRQGLVDKSISHFQKMKQMGYNAPTPLTYNDLMCLYTRIGRPEKVLELLADMKKNGIPPDDFTYRVCIIACGATSDVSNMERVLQEMESQCNITMDWTIYSSVAIIYNKAGLKEKALMYLEKCEDKIHDDAFGYYDDLIARYASLGNKEDDSIENGEAKQTSHSTANGWAVVAAGYAEKLNTKEALEWMKEALVETGKQELAIFVGNRIAYCIGSVIEMIVKKKLGM